jgi:hypothetical protein
MSREKDLIDHIKRHLDESVADLDAPTAARIAVARATALREGTKRRLVWRWPAVGLATAAAGLLAFMITSRSVPPQLTAEHREVLEIIASEKNIELFENLEFYAWLAENRSSLGGG